MTNNASIKVWGISIVATGGTAAFCYAAAAFLQVDSFAFAWSLNFLLMAWFTILVNQIKPKLDSSYFCPASFERDGQLYRYTGVLLYRKLLAWIGWEKMKQKEQGRVKASTLQALEYNTRVSETGHSLIFLIVLAISIITTNTLAAAKWFWLTNIFLNVLPVLLQRYNRPRYLKLLNRYR